jgi:hypothetical protein
VRYGSEVHEGRTLFPLGIKAVELAPEGHVELVIGHGCEPKVGATAAGRVLLSPTEATALAEELHSLVDANSHAQPMDHGHTQAGVSGPPPRLRRRIRTSGPDTLTRSSTSSRPAKGEI